MSDPGSTTKIDRRTLLVGAIALLGGAAALSRLALRPGSRSGDSPALNGQQFALLEQVVDVMIPSTDTPGALAAGVPEFIHDMMSDWASERSRGEMLGVLEALQKSAWARFGAAFLELTPERRLEVLSAYDDAAITRRDSAYENFKFLVLAGYYLSEVGATEELRFELVPGAWRSCLPLTEVGRASAV